MILAIDYAAIFSYAEPVSLSRHDVRVFPRSEAGQRVLRQEFSCGTSADVRFRRDAFDNLIASCFFPEAIDALSLRLALEVEVAERNPFDFLLDERAVSLPIRHTATEEALLAPYRGAEQLVPLPGPLCAGHGRPTLDTILAMNRWIHESIDYERRDEGPPLPIEQTLATRRGCCRDVSVLLVAVLRRHGVAARLAAGFVWEGDAAPDARRAESAMHAWVEAYLPGAGWTGLDPTNGVLCDHHFLPVAVGLGPDDIAPLSGSFFHAKTVSSRLLTSLSVTKR